MNEKLKEFLQKIHSPKNKIPAYATIIIRPGKRILDFKIKKEAANILKVIAHDEKQAGWFLHSIHIPIKNLGLAPKEKNKEILEELSKERSKISKLKGEIEQSIHLQGEMLSSQLDMSKMKAFQYCHECGSKIDGNHCSYCGAEVRKS
ncbi:hypothetical protein LCGC14_1851680 [marine sediment metagenome]|uniref:Zinc-ribbon domain-containing protein n=1 Tax=marine sediment metagenome TaxID=412755 RepID=A0A0F9J9E9_9ZZZZ